MGLAGKLPQNEGNATCIICGCKFRDKSLHQLRQTCGSVCESRRKTKGGTGRPVGRPQKHFDYEQFESLCGFQCTMKEIAGFFKINEETLINKIKAYYGKPFSEVFEYFMLTGKCSLRRSQFVLAKTNPSMAIHLGKVYLDQNFIQKVETTQEITQKAILELPDNGRRVLDNEQLQEAYKEANKDEGQLEALKDFGVKSE